MSRGVNDRHSNFWSEGAGGRGFGCDAADDDAAPAPSAHRPLSASAPRLPPAAAQEQKCRQTESPPRPKSFAACHHRPHPGNLPYCQHHYRLKQQGRRHQHRKRRRHRQRAPAPHRRAPEARFDLHTPRCTNSSAASHRQTRQPNFAKVQGRRRPSFCNNHRLHRKQQCSALHRPSRHKTSGRPRRRNDTVCGAGHSRLSHGGRQPASYLA